MHIPDGWIDLPTSLGAGGFAAAAVTVSARRAAAVLKERVTTLPAVLTAYLLVAQLLVVPVGLGTSAHLVGTGLATVLVGPALAIVCVAVVVVVQALLLADGGVTAIGLNILNDGVVPASVAWAVLALARPLLARRRSTRPDPTIVHRTPESAGRCTTVARTDPTIPTIVHRTPESVGRCTTVSRAVAVAAGVAAGLATMAAAAATAAEFVIGGTDVIPAGAVAASLGLAHVVIAGVEGVLTAAVVAVVARLRPDMVPLTAALAPRASRPVPAGDR